jgi:hypothetical protein
MGFQIVDFRLKPETNRRLLTFNLKRLRWLAFFAAKSITSKEPNRQGRNAKPQGKTAKAGISD